MSPFGPLDAKEEDQNEEERLAVARRFRADKTERLRRLVEPVIESEPLEVGEFSTRPLEALAAVPILGAFLALGARLGRGRQRLTPNVLLALDRDRAHLIGIRNEAAGPTPSLIWSRPRSELRIASVSQKFMREQVSIELDGEQQPLNLYANALRANPWAAGVVRALGGPAPKPRDLEPSG